jgi:hypothetical protein
MSSLEYVSVVMNTYKENSEYLLQAIDSYISQKNVNVQLIVSTLEGDPSISLIKKKYDRKVELCISTKKEHPGKGVHGIYYQLNKAMSLVKGDWFCYASSNDVAVLKKLNKEVQYCKNNNKQVCYSDYIITDKMLKIKKFVKFPEFNYSLLLKRNYINDCALVKTSLLKQFLPFDNTYLNCGFWNLWLRTYVKKGNVFIHCPYPGFFYRQEPNSTHLVRTKNKQKELNYKAEKKKMIKNHLKKYPLQLQY